MVRTFATTLYKNNVVQRMEITLEDMDPCDKMLLVGALKRTTLNMVRRKALEIADDVIDHLDQADRRVDTPTKELAELHLALDRERLQEARKVLISEEKEKKEEEKIDVFCPSWEK